MPRQGRVVLPNWPHHVIQRGHNKQVVFRSDEDYAYYLQTLGEWKATLGCQVYAYCLMTNHVHLLINPGPKAANLALLMKRVAGRGRRATAMPGMGEAARCGKGGISRVRSRRRRICWPVGGTWNSIWSGRGW